MNMKKMALAACIVAAGSFAASADQARVNPFLQPSYGTVYDIPPFESISYDDYIPAIRQGIAEREAEIQALSLIHISEPTRPY